MGETLLRSLTQNVLKQGARAISRGFTLSAVIAFAAATASIGNADDLRIYAGVKSSNEVLSDLEYIVSELASKKNAFEDKVFPNVDIFLVGVDPANPIRFDSIVDGTGERRLSMAVPIEDQRNFIRNNVNPIGIDARRMASGQYKLSGDVYNGVLKFVSSDDKSVEYGVFAFEDFPADADLTFADVLNGNARLFAEDYDVAALIDETSGPMEGREKIAAAFRERAITKIERRPDETEAAYALRRHIADAQFDRLESILVGGKRVWIAYSTDTEAGEGRSKLVAEAVPETVLAQAIDLIGSEPSQFASVPTIEDPVATGRMAIPIYDVRRSRYLKLLEVGRPVTLERVDDSEGTAELKEARKTFINLVYDQLVTGAEQSFISGFYEVHAVDENDSSKGNNVAAGITTVDGTNVVAILDAFPAAIEGGEVEKAVDKIGDIAIHKVSAPDIAGPIKDHLGGVTDMYIGVAENAVYFAGGPAGLDLLKTSVDGISPEKTDVAFSLRFHAGPLVSMLDEIMTKRDFSIIEFLQDRRENRIEERERDPDDVRRVEVEDPRAWRDAALKALVGKSGDVVDITFAKVDGTLVGETTLGKALLTAAGELIAKFAEDNL